MSGFDISTNLRDGTEPTAAMLSALAEPTRLQAFTLMMALGQMRVGELAQQLGLKMATMSFHLATLKTAGLVQDHRNGREVAYGIHPDILLNCHDLHEVGSVQIGLFNLYVAGPAEREPPMPPAPPAPPTTPKKGGKKRAA